MSEKKKWVMSFLLLLLPAVLAILTPTVYGFLLWFVVDGNEKVLTEYISYAIPYLLFFNHLIALGIVSLYMKKHALSWKEIGISKHHLTLKNCGLGFLIGICSFCLLNLIPNIFGLVEPAESSSSNGFIFFITSITVAPIIEEIIFRGFGITALKKTIGTRWAILLSAFCFALLHIYSGVFWLMATFIFAIVLGLIYLKSKSIYVCIVAHFTMNLGIGLLYILGSM